MKKIDITIATKSCNDCPFRLQRNKYIYCQAETLFPSQSPSHSLRCGGYISYLNRGHDFNKLFIVF